MPVVTIVGKCDLALASSADGSLPASQGPTTRPLFDARLAWDPDTATHTINGTIVRPEAKVDSWTSSYPEHAPFASTTGVFDFFDGDTPVRDFVWFHLISNGGPGYRPDRCVLYDSLESSYFNSFELNLDGSGPRDPDTGALLWGPFRYRFLTIDQDTGGAIWRHCGSEHAWYAHDNPEPTWMRLNATQLTIKVPHVSTTTVAANSFLVNTESGTGSDTHVVGACPRSAGIALEAMFAGYNLAWDDDLGAYVNLTPTAAAGVNYGGDGMKVYACLPQPAGTAIPRVMFCDLDGALILGPNAVRTGGGAILEVHGGTQIVGTTNTARLDLTGSTVRVHIWSIDGSLWGQVGTTSNHPLVFAVNGAFAGYFNVDGSFNVGAAMISSAGDITGRKFNPVTRPTIAGSRGGNAAMADLLTKGAALGLWTDGTSA